MKQAIHANHITFQYEPQEGKVAVPVLENLSLSIEEGSFVAVLGHNGCGKSTLAKHFNAICFGRCPMICVPLSPPFPVPAPCSGRIRMC